MHRLKLDTIDPTWLKVSPFLVIMFFILLSDAILADFVPGYIQEVVGSPLVMGVIMAASSLVGLIVDLIFPQLLRGLGIRNLAQLAIGGALLFLVILLISTWYPLVIVLLIGMAMWGIYYELDSFMTKQFVAEAAPAHTRSAVWGVVGVFRNLAYFLGPLIGAQIVFGGSRGVIIISGAILTVAYLFFLALKLPKSGQADSPHGIHIIDEIKHWKTLGHRIWPVLIISLVAGVIDASFWTTGTVVNDMLGASHPSGGWFLSLYMLPSLFIGFVIAKWGVYQGKKKWAERFLLVGSILLSSLLLVEQLTLILVVVFGASVMFGLSWPLVDAVYSDYVMRMGRRGRKHMVGLSSAVLSLAYIVGPILSGFLALKVGELKSFGYIGILAMLVSLILLFVTPTKIRLPQTDIQTWDTE